MTVLHQKLSTAYRLIDEGPLKKDLENLQEEQSPEQLVNDALRDALQRMRRLALEEVQRTLDDAEPYVQQLPPTPGGRSLLCAISVRKAHVALLQGDTLAAEAALQRGLSADPDFTLDQAREPPTLVELFERVRSGIGEAPQAIVRVTTKPEGAIIVVSGKPRGVAPLDLVIPANTAVTLWAVQDGYQPRNVVLKTEAGQPRPGPAASVGPAQTRGGLSVQIHLDPLRQVQKMRPLLEGLRAAPSTSRAETAHTLANFLQVDAVILARLGPNGYPRLDVYGLPPRWPAGSIVPASLDLRLEAPAGTRRVLPGWAWGLIGGCIGVLATGLIVGTVR